MGGTGIIAATQVTVDRTSDLIDAVDVASGIEAVNKYQPGSFVLVLAGKRE